MIETIATGTRLRRYGRLVTRIRAEEGSCDFGRGQTPTIQVSWGDVSTAYRSTGIPNVEVQFAAPPAIRRFAQTPAFMKAFLGLGFMQSLLKAQVDWLPEGPSAAARRAGQAVLVGVARNGAGQTVRTRMRTPEAYALTSLTAFDAAKRVAAGEVGAGFQTPSSAFGPDYILSFDGVTRDDLNS
jgi:short subunit dehydrogenase-like uncharacterized protein